MADSPGQSESAGAEVDTEQTLSLNTQQAAQQLNVDTRTVRKYITVGIHTPTGVVTLAARQVRTSHGQEYQIYQNDLDDFKQARDHAATTGQATGQMARQTEESQALLTSTIQIISAELERRDIALAEAQQTIAQAQATIERLAREAGRNEALEQQVQLLQQRIEELRSERDHWQQKAKKSYRICLFPIEE